MTDQYNQMRGVTADTIQTRDKPLFYLSGVKLSKRQLELLKHRNMRFWTFEQMKIK